ncbi:MAG: DUF6340 family protein [Bacteroidia bacterium]|jgi:Family of unknown function (DUF6340)
MKRYSGLLWIALLVSFSSCMSYEKFSIEVMQPSKLVLPPDIKKIAIVSRNLKYANDTLQNYQVKNHKLVKDKVKLSIESLALGTCLDSLSVKLLAQKRFDSIMILPASTFLVNRVKEIRPGKDEWYKILADKTGADGIILLDMFSYFYSQSDEFSDAKVVTSTIWSFYASKQQKIIDRFVHIDTLYWDGKDEAGNYKNSRIPEKQAAIPIAAGVIGANYAKHILPSWIMVYRDIMTSGDAELQKAAKFAKDNKWEEASSIWTKVAESKNKSKKIISLYNLALASEMSGDVDQALKLTSQAATASSGIFRSSENEAVRKYSAVLYRRRTELNKLSTQYEIP